jgi:predicted RNA-binding protein with PUA-like domain
VTNNLARQNLRKVKKGDRIFYYHTGKEKAVVGEMKALADAGPDPASEDPKAVAVEVKAARRLKHPVPLARIKKERSLAQWELVRFSRLSVMAVSEQQWQRVQELSKEDSPGVT